MEMTPKQRAAFRAQMAERGRATRPPRAGGAARSESEDGTRPQKAAASSPDGSPVHTCPVCGGPLGVVNVYHGGRGYVPHDFCQQPGCDFTRKSV